MGGWGGGAEPTIRTDSCLMTVNIQLPLEQCYVVVVNL
jgi:hypothetical protein